MWERIKELLESLSEKYESLYEEISDSEIYKRYRSYKENHRRSYDFWTSKQKNLLNIFLSLNIIYLICIFIAFHLLFTFIAAMIYNHFFSSELIESNIIASNADFMQYMIFSFKVITNLDSLSKINKTVFQVVLTSHYILNSIFSIIYLSLIVSRILRPTVIIKFSDTVRIFKGQGKDFISFSIKVIDKMPIYNVSISAFERIAFNPDNKYHTYKLELNNSILYTTCAYDIPIIPYQFNEISVELGRFDYDRWLGMWEYIYESEKDKDKGYLSHEFLNGIGIIITYKSGVTGSDHFVKKFYSISCLHKNDLVEYSTKRNR